MLRIFATASVHIRTLCIEFVPYVSDPGPTDDYNRNVARGWPMHPGRCDLGDGMEWGIMHISF